MDKKLPSCDCITNCMDDPRVARGEAEPCNMFKAVQHSAYIKSLTDELIKRAIALYQYPRDPGAFTRLMMATETYIRITDEYAIYLTTEKTP